MRREVIQWYQYQIAVKTMRALSGQKEELEEDPEIAISEGFRRIGEGGADRHRSINCGVANDAIIVAGPR